MSQWHCASCGQEFTQAQIDEGKLNRSIYPQTNKTTLLHDEADGTAACGPVITSDVIPPAHEPVSVRDANGTVETLGPYSGTVALDDGGLIVFTWRHCYRDGTSFASMRVGDRVRFDAHRYGISSPNVARWGQGAQA